MLPCRWTRGVVRTTCGPVEIESGLQSGSLSAEWTSVDLLQIVEAWPHAEGVPQCVHYSFYIAMYMYTLHFEWDKSSQIYILTKDNQYIAQYHARLFC